MASILPFGLRPVAPRPQSPAPAPSPADALVQRGRQALLAHDYADAEAAFDELSRHPEPSRAHDGRVGLAMLALDTLTGDEGRPPPPTPYRSGGAGPAASFAPRPAQHRAEVAAEPPSAPLAADARFAAAIATLTACPFAEPSELACLGAARAALQLGRPDQAWRTLARLPASPEALLGRAASQVGLGAPARARELLWPAVRPWSMGPRLGVGGPAHLSYGGNFDPEVARAALMAAYLEVDGVVGDNDPVYGAKDLAAHLRRVAPDGYAAAALEVTSAAGDARKAAWEALCDRWPRSAHAVMLGVSFGFVSAEARTALLRERPRDAVLQRATLLGAAGAEAWATAATAAEALWQARPTAELGGMLVQLGSLAGQDPRWMRERVARTFALDDAEPQSVLFSAREAIAANRVDEAVVEKLQRATSARPEAYVSLAQALQRQGRHEEALAALNLFLVPKNAFSGLFGTALLLRAKHRLYEEGSVVLDHDAACAEVGLALDDLQRIGRADAAYGKAVELQSLLADRRAQISAGVRYRLNEQQVRHELKLKAFDRVRANLEHHGRSIENQESDLFWLLCARTYEEMGPGNFEKARYAAGQAIEVALQRRRDNTAAEEILRRLQDLDEGYLHRALSFINSVFNWLASLLGGGTK